MARAREAVVAVPPPRTSPLLREPGRAPPPSDPPDARARARYASPIAPVLLAPSLCRVASAPAHAAAAIARAHAAAVVPAHAVAAAGPGPYSRGGHDPEGDRRQAAVAGHAAAYPDHAAACPVMAACPVTEPSLAAPDPNRAAAGAPVGQRCAQVGARSCARAVAPRCALTVAPSPCGALAAGRAVAVASLISATAGAGAVAAAGKVAAAIATWAVAPHLAPELPMPPQRRASPPGASRCQPEPSRAGLAQAWPVVEAPRRRPRAEEAPQPSGSVPEAGRAAVDGSASGGAQRSAFGGRPARGTGRRGCRATQQPPLRAALLQLQGALLSQAAKVALRQAHCHPSQAAAPRRTGHVQCSARSTPDAAFRPMTRRP